jgi:pimeloyl-ACP methyl ester carboxylesterase
MTHQHVTAPTQFVEANGIRFAYRRFGQEGGTPLLFMQHFRGGMDHWDPTVPDGFAKNRPVILFDNAGVASSSGQTPDTIDAMAEHAADFVAALGLSQIDLLGFSIGGFSSRSRASSSRRSWTSFSGVQRALRAQASCKCARVTPSNLANTSIDRLSQ